MVIATMRLVSLNKERQTASDHEIDQQTVDQEVRKQLLLNEKAMKYINAWTVTWQNTKEENGKYFLKDIAADIDKRSNDLERLGEGLKEASAELEWCSQQK
ncbi:unnamed protein product [Phytophthora lilii]|uniref:Unnamed protein product n=1 Tax=Phytophthora lilii TaxID=2077276 RepID=A0A9W6WUA3_9STRA|nr:unnamed protein product [Phytophthora lilii]